MKPVNSILMVVAVCLAYTDAKCTLPQKIANGRMDCGDGTDEPGTQCTFECNSGFERNGAPKIICLEDGWKNTPPTCEPVCKPLPDAPMNGFKTCDGCGELGTTCTFDCEIGYEMDGAASTECESSGGAASWSNKTPLCKKTKDKVCKPIIESNLVVTCDNEILVEGTVCTFECKVGELVPESVTETECVKKGNGTSELDWSKKPPCCVDCSKVKKDIVILMDASDSVTVNDWKLMRNFIGHVVKEFEVGPKTVRFEIVQYAYSQKVLGGTKSKYFTQSKSTILDLLKNWPRNGGGTYTGSALTFLRKNMLKSGSKGNRKDVSDMLWILTDGQTEPPKEFKLAKSEAEKLRNRGVEILALAVGDYKTFVGQLTQLTGDKEKIIKVENTAGLTHQIVDMVSDQICDKKCVE